MLLRTPAGVTGSAFIGMQQKDAQNAQVAIGGRQAPAWVLRFVREAERAFVASEFEGREL